MAKRGRKPKGDGQGWGVDKTTKTEVTGEATASVQVIAPEPSPLDPIVLPPADEALRLLEALAIQNDRVALARKRFEDSQATTKARKGTWESEAKALEMMLTEATHAKPLPLFDAVQSEADLKALEDAVRESVVAGAPLPLETTSSEEPTPGSVLPFVAPEGSGAGPEAAPTSDVF